MTRLKRIGCRLSAPRVARDRDQVRQADQPWRRWYRTRRWAEVRKRVLERDGFTCQLTGTLLIGKAPASNSPVVDHIEPHLGDPELFWDEGNLQALSKAAHDGLKQRADRSGQAWGGSKG